MRLAFSVAVLAGLLSCHPAAAEDAPGRIEIAGSTDFSPDAGPRPQTNGRGPAQADRSVRPVEDGLEAPLVENGWDFNRPETIPGFGPWQIPQ